MCNVIDVETQNNLQYVFIQVSSSAIRFKVKAANDAHIALTSGNFESDPMTELRIGGWGNTKSSVRRDRRKPDKVEVNTPGILKVNEYVGLWVRWYDNYIATGLEGSETPFMCYKEPSPHHIDHVAVRTGWGATGSWKIEVSPVFIKPLTPKPQSGDLHWVPITSKDEVPYGAVIGGFEKGEVLYVARAIHNGSVRPGKYVPSLKQAFLCYGGIVHRKDRFEILCGNNLTWVKMEGDALPPHAFPGGSAIERNNETLYIGRAFIESSLVLGTIYLHCAACYMPYGDPGIEKGVKTFEVLSVPEKMHEKLIWHPPKSRRRVSVMPTRGLNRLRRRQQILGALI